MRLATPARQRVLRSEQIILFRVAGQLFAVSSASVQEVRGVDSLSGTTEDISVPSIRKVRHTLRRGDRTLYVVNAALHFGLPASPPALVFFLRGTRTALLIDAIEKMTFMTHLQALPAAFCHEERTWYRGLTALEQLVVPVVHPGGFLSADELHLLDASLAPQALPPSALESSQGLLS